MSLRTVLAHRDNPLFDLPARAAHCGERFEGFNRLAAMYLKDRQVRPVGVMVLGSTHATVGIELGETRRASATSH